MPRTVLLLSLLILSTGCTHRLPNIKASEIRQTTSFPGFTSTVDAVGINITDTYLKASEVQWRVSSMGVTVLTSAKDYQQRREKEPDEKP